MQRNYILGEVPSWKNVSQLVVAAKVFSRRTLLPAANTRFSLSLFGNFLEILWDSLVSPRILWETFWGSL